MAFGGRIKRDKMDIVFSKLVRALAKHRCEACGDHESTTKIECAHVIPRRYVRTRWLIENARSLCFSCHRYYTEHPLEWVEFIGISEYQRLREIANSLAKFTQSDKDIIYKNLKAQLADVERRAA